jgi:hypothetical protein
MLRQVLAVSLCLMITVGGLLASDGEFVRLENGIITFKVGGKEMSAKLSDLKMEGKPIVPEKFRTPKAGTKFDITVDGDKITEIRNLKKKK